MSAVVGKGQLRAAEARAEKAEAERDRLAGALRYADYVIEYLVDGWTRYRGGDETLDPEEFYIRTEDAARHRKAIAAALASIGEGTDG